MCVFVCGDMSGAQSKKISLPVKANGNLKFLILLARKLYIRIIIDISLIHASINVIIRVVVIILM